jgi:hypothetical protein
MKKLIIEKETIKMKKDVIKLALLVVPVLFVVQTGLSADTTKVSPAEPAQGEEINWQVISSGGTEATSTSFNLKGTLGQTAVGYGSSANYGLSHGFWKELGGGCCNDDGIRGDADNSGGAPNVGDIAYLVEYLFGEPSGPAPPCFEEGDVDASSSINVGDLSHLVSYLFDQPPGPAPLPCP